MYLVKTPRWIQHLMPGFTWRMETNEKVLFLTFDDGPIPEVTPWVLEQLRQYDAKATFFCVGQNVQRHPAVFRQVVEEEHGVGNHTFNHLSGCSTPDIEYYHNVRHAARLVNSPLFRPPYGRMRPSQRAFLSRHYRIVMWDVLSGDFDASLSPEQCLKNVLDNAGPGSIVVMHDSLKSESKLRFILPRILQHFSEQGYRFEALAPKSVEALLV